MPARPSDPRTGLMRDAAQREALVRQVAPRAAGGDRRWLSEHARLLAGDGDTAARVAAALAPELAAAAARHPDRSRETCTEPVLRVTVDRERARFGAWYEMFPRSTAAEPGRHGTFRDVEARLPAVTAMGFDVLYLPPVHPIGRAFRKGPNNTLTAGPDHPGS